MDKACVSVKLCQLVGLICDFCNKNPYGRVELVVRGHRILHADFWVCDRHKIEYKAERVEVEG